MTSYAVPCYISMNNNSHFMFAELRIVEDNVPLLICGIRALLDGKVDSLTFSDRHQRIVVLYNAEGDMEMHFETGEKAAIHPGYLERMEDFALDRLFRLKKPGVQLAMDVRGSEDFQASVSLMIGTR